MAGFGIDPSTGQPVPQPDQQGPPQVDPGSPPADPMLAGPTSGDQTAQEDAAEFQTRERVELVLLLTIEQLGRAGQVGEGAANMDYVSKAGMAAQAYALAYNYLATIEQKENAPTPTLPPQFGGPQPVAPSPSQGMAA